MIYQTPPVWSKDSATLLKQFIESPVGEVFLANLASERPALSSHLSDVNEVALASKYVQGFEVAFNRILSLCEPPEVTQLLAEEAFPDLDDEKAWEKKSPPTP